MKVMITKLEPCLWVFAMAALSFFSVHRDGVRFSNDSYQYLSVAEQIRTAGKIATSIVHFDTERARAQLPAPETTFPPGYSAAIDSLAWTHLSPEESARLISLAGMLTVVPLLWYAAGLFGVTMALRRIAVGAWVLNSQAIGYSGFVLSEGLFTAVLLVVIVLLIFSELGDRITNRLAVPVAIALIGLSYWIRYAAILVAASLAVYACWLAVRRDSRAALWFASLPLCFGPIACAMIRNSRIAGTWRGGNDLVVHRSLLHICIVFVKQSYLLLFGSIKATEVLGIVVACLVLAILFTLIASAKNLLKPVLLRSPVPLLITLLAGYSAGMFYLGTHTVISFDARYFIPIVPEFILLCAAVFSRYWLAASKRQIRQRVRLLATAAMLGYVFLNLYDLTSTRYVSIHIPLTAFYNEPTSGGIPLKNWVDTRIPPQTPVLATDGQATAYVLHHPTISTVEPAYSARRWDEEEVRRTMSTYHAKYLITYPGLSSEQEESQFLRSLNEGEHPSWLVPTVRTANVEIFEMLTPPDSTVTSQARP